MFFLTVRESMVPKNHHRKEKDRAAFLNKMNEWRRAWESRFDDGNPNRTTVSGQNQRENVHVLYVLLYGII